MDASDRASHPMSITFIGAIVVCPCLHERHFGQVINKAAAMVPEAAQPRNSCAPALQASPWVRASTRSRLRDRQKAAHGRVLCGR